MQCRSCGSTARETKLNLGFQFNGSYFPWPSESDYLGKELNLCRCRNCDLVQLSSNLDLTTMFTSTYGYSSSLNSSMRTHLENIVDYLYEFLRDEHVNRVVDIGANDGTLINYARGVFSKSNFIGVDPTIKKWLENYSDNDIAIEDFFSVKSFSERTELGVDLVTSIAMFYDLPDPISFLSDVKTVLRPGGYWFSEQSYLYSMVDQLSYDTICHEHLEYYSLTAIQHMISRVGFRIIDLNLTSANGGSMSILCQREPYSKPVSSKVSSILKMEQERSNFDFHLETFANQVQDHKIELLELLNQINSIGGKITGIGASTKGNTLLQHLRLDSEILLAIEEINPEKWGRVTPGTRIPIVDAHAIHSLSPTHKLVLPWHFGRNIVEREEEFLNTGGKLVFPLPKIKTIGKQDVIGLKS